MFTPSHFQLWKQIAHYYEGCAYCPFFPLLALYFKAYNLRFQHSTELSLTGKNYKIFDDGPFIQIELAE